MIFSYRKLYFALTVILGLSFINTGCVANKHEQQMRMQQQREDSLVMQEDLRRIRSRLESLEQDMMRLSQFVNESNADQAQAYQSQVQAMNTSLDDLQKQIRIVDANRERDKKEVVDALSSKIASMMRTQSSRSSSRSSRPISGEGYEHVVEAGETLSAIAKAYSVRSDDIVRANNLKSADMLYVGQTLFIPAP